MKNCLYLFILFLFSCSTAKQLNRKWIGKTDQQVVNEFGTPDSVASYEKKGKIYFYETINSHSIGNPHFSAKDIANGKNYHSQAFHNQKNIFFIDSFNKVCNVLSVDSNYTKGNFFTIKH